MLKFLYREWLIWRAQRRLNKNDPYSAVRLLSEALKHSPESLRVKLLLYYAYVSQGDLESAEAIIKKALEQRPDNPTYNFLLGVIYFDLHRLEPALQLFERCLALQPENQLAHNFKALTLYLLGNRTQAIELLRKHGLSTNKDFLSRFAAIFEKEVAEHPDLFPEPVPQYEELRNSLLYRLYNLTSGMGLVNKCVKFLMLRKCFRRATRFMNCGNFSAAIAIFNFILQLIPNDRDAITGIAISHYEQGNFDKAKEIFFDLLERDIFDPPLIMYLGLCYYRLGNYNTALALFERISDNRPEDYNANYYAGLCYLALGNRVQAIRAFEKAFKKYFVDTTELCLKKLLQRVFSYTEKQSA